MHYHIHIDVTPHKLYIENAAVMVQEGQGWEIPNEHLTHRILQVTDIKGCSHRAKKLKIGSGCDTSPRRRGSSKEDKDYYLRVHLVELHRRVSGNTGQRW